MAKPKNIPEMKAQLLEIMKEAYDGKWTKKNEGPQGAAKEFFVREQDAKAIAAVCKSKNMIVTFREAGQHTLTRIDDGNPCKGHEILDKSIKKGPKGWTYTYDEKQLKEWKGLVGHESDAKNILPLKGIWVLDGKNGMKVKLIQDFKPEDVRMAFTGDYDMHDLLKAGKRILAGTPDEESAIDALNVGMLAADKKRTELVAATGVTGRKRESQYALIRHGAQTSYISYLLGPGSGEFVKKAGILAEGQIPDQDKIANISNKICIFDEAGQIFIADSVKEVYQFYKSKDLLNQISFYFFFNDLAQNHAEKIKECADMIVDYLKKIYAKKPSEA